MGTRAERKEDFGGGFGFGVVENSLKDVMVLPNHHPYQSPSSFCYCSTGVVTDPIFSASSNNNQVYTPSPPSDMFCLTGSGSGSGSVSLPDPFFTLSSSSSGEIGRAFSESQRQELERQRSIYKYIMASVPVPSELLSPFPKTPSNTNPDVAKGGSLKLGIASNAGDLEPWRCKRTDGKKWRCSRNVIPDQKYCERHTHKSRPRSRKHVESSSSHHNNDITRTTAKADTSIHFARTAYPQFYGQQQHESQFSLVSTLPSHSTSYDHHQRGLRWFMKENDPITTLNPERSSREIKENGLGFDYDLNFKQKEPLVDQSSFGALQGLLSLNQTPQETRRFIVDRGEQDEAMGSSLTLSMAGAMEEAECRNQNQWVSHEGPSWLCSTTPGGPLAEALCLGVSNNPSTSTTTSSCSRSSS